MAKKDYLIDLLLPLCLKDCFDIRALNEGLKSISLNFDFENGVFKVFMRSNNDKFIIETVSNFLFNLHEDVKLEEFLKNGLSKEEDVKLEEFLKNGLSKENEKELVEKKFSKRSSCKKC